MEGERRFAFIPVALPHFVSLPLPPSVSLPPRPSPSFSCSLRCHPFLPGISHQCPLWSKRASHIKFCRRHFQEGCCIQVAFWKASSHLIGRPGGCVAPWTRRQGTEQISGAEEDRSPLLCSWCRVTCRFKHLMDPSANTSPLLSALGSVQPRRCVHINISFRQICGDTYQYNQGQVFYLDCHLLHGGSDKGRANSLSLSFLSSLQPSLPVFPAWLVHSSALHL